MVFMVSMKKLIERIKQFRLVGYLTIAAGMYKAGVDTNTLIIEMFLMVILVELSSRTGKKVDLKNKKELEDLTKDF